MSSGHCVPENGAGLSRWERGQQSLRAWKEEPRNTVLRQCLFSFVSNAHMCLSMCALTCAHATEGPRLTSGAFLSCSLFGGKWLY